MYDAVVSIHIDVWCSGQHTYRCMMQWSAYISMYDAVVSMHISVWYSGHHTYWCMVQWSSYILVYDAVVSMHISVWCSGQHTYSCMVQWSACILVYGAVVSIHIGVWCSGQHTYWCMVQWSAYISMYGAVVSMFFLCSWFEPRSERWASVNPTCHMRWANGPQFNYWEREIRVKSAPPPSPLSPGNVKGILPLSPSTSVVNKNWKILGKPNKLRIIWKLFQEPGKMVAIRG